MCPSRVFPTLGRYGHGYSSAGEGWRNALPHPVSRGIRESPLPRSTGLPACLPPNFNKFHPKFLVILFSHLCRHVAATFSLRGIPLGREPPLSSSSPLLFPLSLHNQQRNPPLIALWPAFRDRPPSVRHRSLHEVLRSFASKTSNFSKNFYIK